MDSAPEDQLPIGRSAARFATVMPVTAAPLPPLRVWHGRHDMPKHSSHMES